MNAIDGRKFRRVVQAVGTVLVQVIDAKGGDLLKNCEEIIQSSTVARKWWKTLEARDQLLLFEKARKTVRSELGRIRNRRRKSVAQ